MNEVKSYLRFKEERDALDSGLTKTASDISRLTEELSPIEEKSLKSEILQSPGFEKEKEGLRKIRQQIVSLRTELEGNRRKLMIVNECLPEFRSKAYRELQARHHKLFEGAIKAFAEKIQAAHKAEVELTEVREKALAKFKQIDSDDCPLVQWKPILMRLFEFKNSMREWEEQLERWKNEGYRE